MSQSPNSIFRPRSVSHDSPQLPKASKEQNSLTPCFQREQITPPSSFGSDQHLDNTLSYDSYGSYNRPRYISIDDRATNSKPSLALPSFDDDDDDFIIEQSSATMLVVPEDKNSFSSWSILASRFSSKLEFDEY
eukprot:scaffold5444_cov157-Amphora_coffeaeformis.AAC.3